MNNPRFHHKSLQSKEGQGTQMSSSVALLGLTGLVLVHQACAPIETTQSGMSIIEEVDSSVMTDLLTGVGTNVILPTLLELRRKPQNWKSLEVLENAYGTDQQELAFEAAREQWKNTMQVWQELEVCKIGPVGSELHCVSGESIRDSIYRGDCKYL